MVRTSAKLDGGALRRAISTILAKPCQSLPLNSMYPSVSVGQRQKVHFCGTLLANRHYVGTNSDFQIMRHPAAIRMDRYLPACRARGQDCLAAVRPLLCDRWGRQ